jgi:hypothetical protein
MTGKFLHIHIEGNLTMKRVLMVAVLLFSAFVFTAFAQSPGGCCGKDAKKGSECKMGPGCKMGAGCKMGPECKMGSECPPMGMGMGGPMMGMMGASRDLVTLRGRVVSIEQGPQGGMRVMVESDSRITAVMIRPDWFEGDLQEQLEPQDRVEVTGMLVSRDGHSHLMPGKITIRDDNKMITLRRHMEKPEDMPENMPPDMPPPPMPTPNPKAY